LAIFAKQLKGEIEMAHYVTPELAAKYPDFVTTNNNGEPIINRATILRAPDDAYYELNDDAHSRFRAWQPSDCRPLLRPVGLKLYVFTNRDIGTVALYGVDERLHFAPNVSLEIVLTQAPQSWPKDIKHSGVVGHFADIKTSVMLPFA